MIRLNLTKNMNTQKMHVKSWEVVPKEEQVKKPAIEGMRAYVDNKLLPKDFYKSHTKYYYENGVISYAAKDF